MASHQGPVLLVIDLQEGIVNPAPRLGPRSTPALASNVAKILQFWRAHQWPLIHIHHEGLEQGHPLHPVHHPEQFKAHACSAPEGDEVLLHKQTGSAFVPRSLDLENRLVKLGGKTDGVVIIGMDGSQCINDNTRSANDLGFKVTVVADACATFGMSDYRNADWKIGPEDSHNSAMSLLANGFAQVVMTDDYLSSLHN